MKKYLLTIMNNIGNKRLYLIPEDMMVASIRQLTENITILGWTFEFELIDQESWNVLSEFHKIISPREGAEHKFNFFENS